jgi:hypothetical protein
MVAMSGAIMPEPLQMPPMPHRHPVDLRPRRRPLREGVGGHDGAGRRAPAVGRQAVLDLGQAGGDLASSRSTPITPVEATITSRWRQSKRLPTAEATRRTASAPGRPVKELAQPALTTRARTPSPLLASRWRLHQSTGAEAHPVAGEHPGAGRALREAHHQEVVALVLVEAGPAGRQADPLDRRHPRKGHRQGRDQHGGLVDLGGGLRGLKRARGLVGAAQRGALQRVVSGSKARSSVWPTTSTGLGVGFGVTLGP